MTLITMGVKETLNIHDTPHNVTQHNGFNNDIQHKQYSA
jgi:hypothetical protein